MKRICVFCGSSPGVRPQYLQAARETGLAIVERGLGLVYGGSNVGLMAEIADTVLDAGGEAIGVMPEALMAKELAHPRLTRLHIVKSMHERKTMMSELADAFVALPGGYGTFEEFCEIITWAQLGIHQKPCGLLNVCGYFNGLLALFDHAVQEQFLRPQNRGIVLDAADPATLLNMFESYQPVQVPKWIGREES
jgi:uncharacterized protein (TIGR00730 family)